jgi:hypothetical protein
MVLGESWKNQEGSNFGAVLVFGDFPDGVGRRDVEAVVTGRVPW